MQYQTGQIGRIFWVRVDHGEDLIQGLKDLALKEDIDQALILALGALGRARIVVGPKETVVPPVPVWSGFTKGREILGIGTLARDPEGPAIHLHLAAGREDEPVSVGCLRDENEVYLLVEVVVLEISGFSARREPDAATGLNLLQLRGNT